jgi:hypothetical protein
VLWNRVCVPTSLSTQLSNGALVPHAGQHRVPACILLLFDAMLGAESLAVGLESDGLHCRLRSRNQLVSS